MFRICTLRSLIFYACISYQFMYGLTVWKTYLPKCFHKLSNIVCLYTQLILHVYAHVTVVFEIHTSTLHMGHADIVYIHSWLHCCQTSVARRLKQNKTKRLKQQNHEIYHFLGLQMPQGFFVGRTMLLDIHTASSLHGRTQCHIKIVKLFQSLSTCEFPLCSALTLPWQHILFHWVAPWSFFAATVGWVGWLKRFTPSRCLHLIFFWAW